jgi:hypothetical protein
MGYSLEKEKNDARISAGFANWGYNDSFQTNDCYIYPPDKDTLVPCAWDAYEGPLPYPKVNHGIGVPITVSFTSSHYSSGTLALYDSKGKELSCLRSNSAPNPDRFIEISSEYPLEPDTEYTVVFSYGKNKKTTTFRTAPKNPAELMVQNMLSKLMEGGKNCPKVFSP